MNKLSAYFTTKIAAMAAFIGALVAIVTGYQQFLDFQPFFALKQAVVENERRAAFNRISDLSFQIRMLRADDLSDADRQDDLDRKLAERTYLECSFGYVSCSH